MRGDGVGGNRRFVGDGCWLFIFIKESNFPPTTAGKSLIPQRGAFLSLSCVNYLLVDINTAACCCCCVSLEVVKAELIWIDIVVNIFWQSIESPLYVQELSIDESTKRKIMQ